jgi:hypothetical protein
MDISLRLFAFFFEVRTEQLFKLAEVFKAVFLFFILLSATSLTDYTCAVPPLISASLLSSATKVDVSILLCDNFPASKLLGEHAAISHPRN